MKKKIVLAVGGIFLAIAFFGGGCLLAFKAFDSRYGISDIAKDRIELGYLQDCVEKFDLKDYDSLVMLMNLRLDIEIISIYDKLRHETNINNIDKAKKSLSRIAKHRQTFPAVYPKFRTDPNILRTRKLIEAVLAEALIYK
jgi:hypothetical protein